MVVVVTNRKLCPGDFLSHIHELARAKPGLIILREKDLPEAEYEILWKQCQDICSNYEVPVAVNSRLETARRQGASHLHLPLHLLRQYSGELDGFSQVGASVHSVEDALEAQAMGASYLVAGHIFPTSCKEGVPPRGLSFLKEVCQAVKIPVYAIGGINRNHVPEILAQGAGGFCIMSELMECPDPYRRLCSYLSFDVQSSDIN